MKPLSLSIWVMNMYFIGIYWGFILEMDRQSLQKGGNVIEPKIIIECTPCKVNRNETNSTFPVSTEFAKDDVYDLFFHNYQCPYCCKELNLSAKTIDLLFAFLNRDYHVGFQKDTIEISNGTTTVFLHNEFRLEVMEQEGSTDPLRLLSEKDLQDFMRLRDQVDLSKWKILIESAAVPFPFSSRL